MFLYLIPAVGITVSAHYCGGKLASLSIGEEQGKTCACGSKKMKGSCCEFETINIKLKDTQQKIASPAWNYEVAQIAEPLLRFDITAFYVPVFETEKVFYAIHPPDLPKQPLYIRNCVFII